MKRVVKKILVTEEKGQAMVLVLVLLVVGALILTPLLGFMGTGLLAAQVFEKKMDGFYAADAGVEDALWKIMNDPPASYPHSFQLTDVNGVSVSVLVEEVTDFYGEEVGGGGIHVDWLDLSSERVQDPYPGGGDYIHEWRLSLTNKDNSNISIHSITIAYSNELSYLSGLTDEDVAGLDGSFETFTMEFTYLSNTTTLTWEFSPPRPSIDGAPDPENEVYTTVTATFEFVGPQDAPGISAYLAVARADVGTVWELKPFKITAQVDDGNGTEVIVTARVLTIGEAIKINSWDIK